MPFKSGIDVEITIGGNTLTGLRDAGMTRSRQELEATTVGDDAVQRHLGIKDATVNFNGVMNYAATAMKDILDAARDGTELDIIYQHSTSDNTAEDEVRISQAIVTSVTLDSGIDQLVEFSAEAMGTDTTNGWQVQ